MNTKIMYGLVGLCFIIAIIRLTTWLNEPDAEIPREGIAIGQIWIENHNQEYREVIVIDVADDWIDYYELSDDAPVLFGRARSDEFQKRYRLK